MGVRAISDYTNPRRLLDAGVDVAVSSDWAVGPLDPWKRIGWLVSRVNPDIPGSKPYLPNAAITAKEAVRASTLAGVHVIGVEEETGSIEVGKFADMIVLDRDITVISRMEIKNTQVKRTVFAGEAVYVAQ